MNIMRFKFTVISDNVVFQKSFTCWEKALLDSSTIK